MLLFAVKCLVTVSASQVSSTGCYNYHDYPCCAQVASEPGMSIPCAGSPYGNCRAQTFNDGGWRGKLRVDVGENGFSLESWNINTNGSKCSYFLPICTENGCDWESQAVVWDCHNVILSGACQGTP